MSLIIRLLETLTSIEILILFAHLLMQMFRVLPPWHPVMKLLDACALPVLAPVRRIVPSIGGIDISYIVAILIVGEIGRLLSAVALTGTINIGAELIALLAQLILDVIGAIAILILIRILIAVLQADRSHPLVRAINGMTDPLVRPFRNVGTSSFRDLPAVVALAVYIALYIVVRMIVSIFIA